jgi:hypothetical protein
MEAELRVLIANLTNEKPTTNNKPMSAEFYNDKDKEDIFIENDVLVALGDCDTEDSDEEVAVDLSGIYVSQTGAKRRRTEPRGRGLANNWEASEEEIEASDEETEEGPHAYEDNPMPILKGSITLAEKRKKVKVLIDSGAAINLISRETASELVKVGIEIRREGNIKIKIANGDKASINEVLRIPIKLGGQWTDTIKFFILKNLPFDILIGNPALEGWKANLSWETKTFSMQPRKASTNRIQEIL